MWITNLSVPAFEPSRGDGADADRRSNEQHDGEDFRSQLHRPHVGCSRAGKYRIGISWKGKTAQREVEQTSCSSVSCCCFSLSFSTRWINMQRSFWRPWVQAWRRGTIQVSDHRRLYDLCRDEISCYCLLTIVVDVTDYKWRILVQNLHRLKFFFVLFCR